ncbi:unnamed protein product [Protopolystoma xenopodis]|uniref:Uncharacterized protein n=1 Tax=Protopolystoma xenopodis TaxID=117903 RepID=A0A3S5AMS4_9PLAT|nr:unnamed protein product [Protopolystoma xenopodis]
MLSVKWWGPLVIFHGTDTCRGSFFSPLLDRSRRNFIDCHLELFKPLYQQEQGRKGTESVPLTPTGVASGPVITALESGHKEGLSPSPESGHNTIRYSSPENIGIRSMASWREGKCKSIPAGSCSRGTFSCFPLIFYRSTNVL